MIELDGLYEALKELFETQYFSPLERDEFNKLIFLNEEYGSGIGIAYSSMEPWNTAKFGEDEIEVQICIDPANMQSFVDVPPYLSEYTDKKKIIIDNYGSDEEMIEDIRSKSFDDWYSEGAWKLREAIGDE